MDEILVFWPSRRAFLLIIWKFLIMLPFMVKFSNYPPLSPVHPPALIQTSPKMTSKSHKRAFTLVEMLLVIAIISILAGLVISNISNAAKDTRDVVARQQLAVVQEAVNHWVNHEVGRVGSSGTGKTVSQVMAAYNAADTASARYGLFRNYLDDATRASFDQLDDSTG